MLNFKSELRARAHSLKPVVWVAENADDSEISESVLKEIHTALTAHELIKIRLASDNRETRASWIKTICEKTGAMHVQTIGKIVVVFRKSEKNHEKPLKNKPSKKIARQQKRDFQN